MGVITTFLVFGFVFLRASTFATPPTGKPHVEKPENIKTQLDCLRETTEEIKAQTDDIHSEIQLIRQEFRQMMASEGFLQGSRNKVPTNVTATFDEVDATFDEVDAESEGLRSEIYRLGGNMGSTSAFGESRCPPGFLYLIEAKKCYRVLSDKGRTWVEAARRCQSFPYPAALAWINNAAETRAIADLLDMFSNNRFWVGGQRKKVGDCSSPFIWRVLNGNEGSMYYTNWYAGEPNCYGGQEHCMEIRKDIGYRWNDVPCEEKYFAVCEHN